jgi:hypothetical protein
VIAAEEAAKASRRESPFCRRVTREGTVRSIGGLSLWRPVRSRAYKVRGDGVRGGRHTDRRLSGRIARSVKDASRHDGHRQQRAAGPSVPPRHGILSPPPLSPSRG